MDLQQNPAADDAYYGHCQRLSRFGHNLKSAEGAREEYDTYSTAEYFGGVPRL
jgi:hypothetical protein